MHHHRRPSDNLTRSLIATLLRPEFNRAEAALNADSRAPHPPAALGGFSEFISKYYSVFRQIDKISSRV